MSVTPQPTGAVAPFVWPVRYIGDDWSFDYTFTNPDGSTINLTGAAPQAKLFGKNQIAPISTMSGSSGVSIVDAVTGHVTFTVGRDLTATLAADGCSDDYPTRIQVQLLDSLGKLTTLRVDGVPVDDARFGPIG